MSGRHWLVFTLYNLLGQSYRFSTSQVDFICEAQKYQWPFDFTSLYSIWNPLFLDSHLCSVCLKRGFRSQTDRSQCHKLFLTDVTELCSQETWYSVMNIITALIRDVPRACQGNGLKMILKTRNFPSSINANNIKITWAFSVPIADSHFYLSPVFGSVFVESSVEIPWSCYCVWIFSVCMLLVLPVSRIKLHSMHFKTDISCIWTHVLCSSVTLWLGQPWTHQRLTSPCSSRSFILMTLMVSQSSVYPWGGSSSDHKADGSSFPAPDVPLCLLVPCVAVILNKFSYITLPACHLLGPLPCSGWTLTVCVVV